MPLQRNNALCDETRNVGSAATRAMGMADETIRRRDVVRQAGRRRERARPALNGRTFTRYSEAQT
jgi:hypothetical protein